MIENEMEKNAFTEEGLKRLQDELADRKTIKAAEISERLKDARAQGDLSENSEYDDAKEAQAKNESRIMELEDILKNARVIDEDEISKTSLVADVIDETWISSHFARWRRCDFILGTTPVRPTEPHEC